MEAFSVTHPSNCPQHGSSSFQCPPDQWALESPAFHIGGDCPESSSHSQGTVRQCFRASCHSARGQPPQAKASLEMRFPPGKPLAHGPVLPQVGSSGDQCLWVPQALERPPWDSTDEPHYPLSPQAQDVPSLPCRVLEASLWPRLSHFLHQCQTPPSSLLRIQFLQGSGGPKGVFWAVYGPQGWNMGRYFNIHAFILHIKCS